MSVGASMRCPHGKRWTDAELSYLAVHKDDALCDIAQALGRSENSVRSMMMRKGYIQRTRHARGWADAEDDYLYKRYGRTSAAEIGKRLGRTEESVKHRAAALGLRAYDEYISLKELGRVFGIDLRAIHRWIALYDMPAVKTKHGAGNYWRIDAGAFWAWAEAHQALIPWHNYDCSLPDEPAWAAQAIKSDHAVNHRAPVTRAVKRRAMELYSAGKEIADIAREMGRTPDSVKHILRQSPSARSQVSRMYMEG